MLSGMKRITITQEQINELRRAHRQARNKRDADRIKAIYSLAVGHSVAQVASILMIDEETLVDYQKRYEEGGIPELLKNNHKGSMCRLSDDEIERLKQELQANIHLSTLSVIYFVETNFGLKYTQSGMRDLLHRLGYEYKKPKLVPGNPDIESQEIFAKQYEEFMQIKPSGTEILFLDAVHPEHNTIAAFGWIKRGEIRRLKTNSGRERLNLHGAINAETYQVTLIESETVNADSTINLLTAIEYAYPYAKEIHVILDNAKYHYSKLVKEYLKSSRIKLVFLPSYSPNLNLIERLWKFFKKKVLYNKYYEDLHAFRSACIKFFKNISDYHDEIECFMTNEFEFAY
jgi:transposase